MSAHTVATLPRLPPTTLAALLRTNPKPIIIDVRDSDFLGGHIRSCLHVPTASHPTALPELARTLAAHRVVVFHCALSQQRGPGAALRYLRERERLGVRGGQDVFVLEGGFVGWQELYGEDEELTEGYERDLWRFGY